MKYTENILAAGAATASVGVPEELEKGITQVVIGVLTYFLTLLFNRFRNGKKEK